MGEISDVIYGEQIKELEKKIEEMQEEIEEIKKFSLITNEYMQKMQEHHISLQKNFLNLCREVKNEQS